MLAATGAGVDGFEVTGVAGVGVLAGAGDATPSDGAGAGDGGAGLEPPMFRVIVGAGAGACVTSGRSTGWRFCGAGCGGTYRKRPGTNSDAPILSFELLIVLLKSNEDRSVRVEFKVGVCGCISWNENL